VGHRGEERGRERESAGDSLKKESKLGPSDFQKEVERLKAEGKMPTLEELLEVIGEVRKQYRPKILPARKKKSAGSKSQSSCHTAWVFSGHDHQTEACPDGRRNSTVADYDRVLGRRIAHPA
jgi:hypothetical protein